MSFIISGLSRLRTTISRSAFKNRYPYLPKEINDGAARIRIQTRKMPGLSWRGMIGTRAELKSRIVQTLYLEGKLPKSGLIKIDNLDYKFSESLEEVPTVYTDLEGNEFELSSRTTKRTWVHINGFAYLGYYYSLKLFSEYEGEIRSIDNANLGYIQPPSSKILTDLRIKNSAFWLRNFWGGKKIDPGIIEIASRLRLKASLDGSVDRTDIFGKRNIIKLMIAKKLEKERKVEEGKILFVNLLGKRETDYLGEETWEETSDPDGMNVHFQRFKKYETKVFVTGFVLSGEKYMFETFFQVNTFEFKEIIAGW